MKQTSKVFVGLLVVLLLMVAGGIWFLYSNLETLVARVIEEKGSEATRTPVNVGTVSIDLQAGSAAISSLTVANPENFSDRAAITLKDFAIELDPLEVTSEPLVISEVTVNGTRLLIEQVGTENNLETILSSVQRLSAEDEEAPESAGKKLIIDRFELTDTSAQLVLPQLDESREIQVPDIVLTDIGRASNGATAAAVTQQILEPLIRKALESAAANSVQDAVKEKLGETESRITDELLNRFGEQAPEENDDSGNNPQPEEY